MSLPFGFEANTVIAEGKTTETSLNSIQSWLKTTNFPELSPEFIILFLLSCQNDLKLTQTTIKVYFEVKNNRPEVFNNCDLAGSDLTKITKVIGTYVIPKTANNTAILYRTTIDSNYRNYDNIADIKLFVMLMHLCQIDNPPDNLITVIDASGLRFMHLACIKMAATSSFFQYIQEGMPLKISNIYVLNCNFVFMRLLNMVKLFIKGDLLKAIKTFPPQMDMKEFHREYVPACYLPKQNGGERSLEELTSETRERLEEKQNFFQAEEEMRKWRPG